LVACFTMKAITFLGRGKEKDAYDLYMVIKEYSAGIDAVVAELRAAKDNNLVKEALNAAAESFQSVESMGPIAVADFRELPRGDDRDVIIRDAYEVMKYVLDRVRG
ncbi:MAG TPA: hypothetical protein VJ508_15475, partial [Saprospiraceae bacterium]|nr:hypothetical protein [Saprospiraceae bacterium]